MLNSEFRKLEESVDKALSLNRQKIRDAISEHTTIREKATGYAEHHREHAVQHHRGRTVPAAEKTALAGDQRADTV
ncbi:MbeB family mobilization protein, partial [Klebsiella pneumoniae]|uniref:MbeB family mobilization protein n=1 Tax=Klebsiella pneumoniae TaxID=573 RepID=UPI003D11FF81